MVRILRGLVSGRRMRETKVEAPAIDGAELRRQLMALLRGGQAHAGFEAAVKDFPVDLRARVPEGLPYSAWQLVEHLRIAQRDILNFSAPPTGGYHPLRWPEEYWPKSPEPPNAGAWEGCLAAIRSDLETFEALITRPEADLTKPFRWGDGQNLLREALLIADHTAYHVGELIVLRRLLGAWRT
ncbi:MAG: DinB family protein [Acidobacteriaceae bacterium]